MPYPLVLAYCKEEFSRVNHTGEWSVLWDKAEAVAKEKAGDTFGYIQNRNGIYIKTFLSNNAALRTSVLRRS